MSGRKAGSTRRAQPDMGGLVSAGRARKGVPSSRAEVLAALLRKRAAAWQSGFTDLELQLRSQIRWSLPIERPAEEATAPKEEG